MEAMNTPWVRVAAAVLVLSAIFLFFDERSSNVENEAWAAVSSAREPEFTADSLEDVRQQVEGTSAEPWASFYLAMLLYEENTDLDRARQIASASVASHPDHATAEMMSQLIDALDTYSGTP